MSTINLTSSTPFDPVKVAAGQYLLAVSGIPASESLDIVVNVGDAKGVAVTDANFTADGTKVIWLPECTVFVLTSFPPNTAGYGAALGTLSTKLEDG